MSYLLTTQPCSILNFQKGYWSHNLKVFKKRLKLILTRCSIVGRQCNECKDKNFNLNQDNSLGCLPCECNKVGRMSEICDKGKLGLCMCRGNFTDKNNIRCVSRFWSFKRFQSQRKENLPWYYKFKSWRVTPIDWFDKNFIDLKGC